MDNITQKSYRTWLEAVVDKGLLAANEIDSMIIAHDCGGAALHLLNGTGFVKLAFFEKYFGNACKLLNITLNRSKLYIYF